MDGREGGRRVLAKRPLPGQLVAQRSTVAPSPPVNPPITRVEDARKRKHLMLGFKLREHVHHRNPPFIRKDQSNAHQVAGFHDLFPRTQDFVCRFAFTTNAGASWTLGAATPLFCAYRSCLVRRLFKGTVPVLRRHDSEREPFAPYRQPAGESNGGQRGGSIGPGAAMALLLKCYTTQPKWLYVRAVVGHVCANRGYRAAARALRRAGRQVVWNSRISGRSAANS